MADYGFRIVHFVTDTAIGVQSITIPSGAGSTKTPKLARIVVTGATALDTITNTARASWGLTDGTNQFAVAGMAENGVVAANSDTGYRNSNAACVLITGTSSQGLEAFATVNAMVTGGIELLWGSAPASAYRGYVVLWYGDDLEALATSIAGSSSSGGTASLNPGFTNDPILIEAFSVGVAIGLANAGGEVSLSIGSAGKAGSTITQSCQIVCAEDNESNTSVGNLTNSSANPSIASVLVSAAGTVTESARLDVTAMTASNVEVTTRNAAVSISAILGIIAVAGVKGYSAAQLITAGSTGTKSITAPGFRPLGFAISSCRSGVLDTIGSGQGQLAHGIYSGLESAGSCWADRDNQATSASASFASATNVLDVLDFSSPHDWIANAIGATATGFDLNVSDASAAAGDRVIRYWVIEDINHAPGWLAELVQRRSRTVLWGPHKGR